MKSLIVKIIAALLMLALFIFYLVMAAGGKTVLQIIAAVMVGSIAAFGLWLLFKSKELLRQRSIWITLSFLCCALVTIVSLLAGYPGP